jgi:hypothetical protein
MSLPSRPSTAGRKPTKSVLDQETIHSLHRVIFGHEQREVPPAWHGGFAFRDGGMSCGLRQREGGPCGVLAAVQAFVLREVYSSAPDTAVNPNAVPREAASEALVRALGNMIWAARVGRAASVVSCKTKTLPELRAAAGELTVTTANSAADVVGVVRSCIGSYRSADGPGLMLLLYSVTLTRGIAMVTRDADFPSSLIMPNGYCAQELVNLLLIGRAHSNVFDGERRVGSSLESGSGGDADDGCRLRGVPRKAAVGFLTLFEKQQYGDHDRELIVVGSNYKRPTLPFYVVQSESHYSVLWAAAAGETPPDEIMDDESDVLPGDPDPHSEGYEPPDDDERPSHLPRDGAIDLYYFDQMAERDDAVRLTLRRRLTPDPNSAAPPLELVILSRWPAAQVPHARILPPPPHPASCPHRLSRLIAYPAAHPTTHLAAHPTAHTWPHTPGRTPATSQRTRTPRAPAIPCAPAHRAHSHLRVHSHLLVLVQVDWNGEEVIL